MTIGAAGPAYTVVVGMTNIPASVNIPITKHIVDFADKRFSVTRNSFRNPTAVIARRVFFPTKQSPRLPGDCFAKSARSDTINQNLRDSMKNRSITG